MVVGAVVVGVDAPEVARAGEELLDVQLGAAHVLADHDRRAHLGLQRAMAARGQPAVGVRVLEPEQAVRVADAADAHRVGERREVARSTGVRMNLDLAPRSIQRMCTIYMPRFFIC